MSKLTGVPAFSLSAHVIVPAPAVHQSAAEVRGSHRFPIRIQPHELRTGMRIGCRVLVGETAVREDWRHRGPGLRSWTPVILTKEDPRPLDGLRWLCRCDCGREQYVCVCSLITASALSCGCWARAHHSYLMAERNRARRADFSCGRAVA